jgi:Domain of unknown function (DUF4190)
MEPQEPYLVNMEGEVYGWVPDLQSWKSTGRTEPDAAKLLWQIGASDPSALPKPDQPWADIAGRPLYRDPRIPYIPLPRPPVIPKMNGLAQAARVLSFIGIVFLPFAILGTICGIIALGQIRDRGEQGRDAAITAIVVGGLIIGLISLSLIIIAANS